MPFRNIDWILTVPYNIMISNSQIGFYVYIPLKMNFWWKSFPFQGRICTDSIYFTSSSRRL